MAERSGPDGRGGGTAAEGPQPLTPSPLVDLVPTATWVLDATGAIDMWSAAAEQLFGLPREQVIGRHALEALHVELPGSSREELSNEVREANPFSGVFRIRLPDGSIRVVESRVAVAEDAAGDRFVLITSMDAEQLHKVEADLAMREALFDQSPIGVGIFDTALNFIAVNEAMAAMDGVPRAGHLGRTVDEVLPGVDTARVRAVQQRVLDTGEPVVDSRIFGSTPPDGSARPVWSMSYNRLQARNGTILGISCSLVDVTERHYAMVKVDAARKRLALLNEAGTRIGGTLDIVRITEELVASVVPGFADLAAVDLLEGALDGHELVPGPPGQSSVLFRVASRGARPGRYTEELLAQGTKLVYPAESAFGRCLRTGGSYLMSSVQDDMYEQLIHDMNRAEAARVLGLHTMMVVPLSARGSVLGTLLLGRGEGRPAFDPDDLTLATELAARAGVSVDNARLYHRQRDTAVMLQRSLLPQELPELPGVDVAHRYLPGSVATEVGGDWYDVIPLSGARIGLVVGDVMGHGVQAAAVMGQLRTAVRTLASLDMPPAEVMRNLDAIVVSLGELHYATCAYVVYDPVERTGELASAGHLPPLLLPPEGPVTELEQPSGALLGIGGVTFDQISFQVEEGTVLTMYTDGLVEDRDRDIDTGIAQLGAALEKNRGPLEQAADTVIAALHTQAGYDDVALLMTRLSALPDDAVASWWLPAEPTVVGRARELTRKTLSAWQLDGLVDSAELLVSELVTNALRYGQGPVRLRLIRGKQLLCEVADSGKSLPRLRDAQETDEGGRGLALVSMLAERWGTRQESGGKVVWFELTLPS